MHRQWLHGVAQGDSVAAGRFTNRTGVGSYERKDFVGTFSEGRRGLIKASKVLIRGMMDVASGRPG